MPPANLPRHGVCSKLRGKLAEIRILGKNESSDCVYNPVRRYPLHFVPPLVHKGGIYHLTIVFSALSYTVCGSIGDGSKIPRPLTRGRNGLRIRVQTTENNVISNYYFQ